LRFLSLWLPAKTAFHLAMQTEENLRAGMPAAEARRQAVLKFGIAEAVREDYHDEQGLLFLENVPPTSGGGTG
jgi:hypothetical protein